MDGVATRVWRQIHCVVLRLGPIEEQLEVQQHHGWAPGSDSGGTLKNHEHFGKFTAGSTEEKHIPEPTTWSLLTGRVRY
jgi:hypothetical protein